MDVKVLPKAQRYIEDLNEPIQGRIKAALYKLEQEPPRGDIKAMSGRNGFRLRVGNYRILFSIVDKDIIISEIGVRGQVYKKR